MLLTSLAGIPTPRPPDIRGGGPVSGGNRGDGFSVDIVWTLFPKHS